MATLSLSKKEKKAKNADYIGKSKVKPIKVSKKRQQATERDDEDQRTTKMLENLGLIGKVESTKEGPKFGERRTQSGERPITLEQAKKKFTDRFTLDHVPVWASKPCARAGGKYPGPHYNTDAEWYAKAEFIGYLTKAQRKYVRENKPSYPMGKWLDKPYVKVEGGTRKVKVLTKAEKYGGLSKSNGKGKKKR